MRDYKNCATYREESLLEASLGFVALIGIIGGLCFIFDLIAK